MDRKPIHLSIAGSILEEVLATLRKRPLRAHDVFVRLIKNGAHLTRTGVHRSLTKLCEIGLVHDPGLKVEKGGRHTLNQIRQLGKAIIDGNVAPDETYFSLTPRGDICAWYFHDVATAAKWNHELLHSLRRRRQAFYRMVIQLDLPLRATKPVGSR